MTGHLLQTALQHHQSGRLDLAKDLYRQILTDNPDSSDALRFLGLIAYDQGDYHQAEKWVRRSLTSDASNFQSYLDLGNILYKMNKMDQAIDFYQQALDLNPSLFEAEYNIANIYLHTGQFSNAISHYKKALEKNPNLVEAFLNLGIVFSRIGDNENAMKSYRLAVEKQSTCIEAWNNIGNLLKDQGRLQEAISHYQQALQINDKFSDAHYNLGNVYCEQGKFTTAEVSFWRALETQPYNIEILNNLGNTLKEQGKLTQAISVFQKVIQLHPKSAWAYNGMGSAYQAQGNLDEAIHCYRSALDIDPAYAIAFSNFLMAINYHSHHNAEAIFAEHKRFADIFAEPLRSEIIPHTNSVNISRKLRIGYVSPDFRRHSVGFFIESVLKNHDHDRFEIFCYSNVTAPDNVTKRLQGYTDHWRDITRLSDDQVSANIQDDQIDILIDLAGHTAFNRLLVFARKPAPLQMTWLGYPNTTGLTTIDYRITDGYADPPGTTEYLYSEQLLRLPDTFLCFLPDSGCPKVSPLPATTRGMVTFGSFNNLSKVTPSVIRMWAQILLNVPKSNLIIKARALADEDTNKHIISTFKKSGIDAERIITHSITPSFQEHLKLYNLVDIGLDPFPYHGTTTTCEALWMGVPVITLVGSSHVSRVGMSLLANIGLEQYATSSPDDYVASAIRLSSNLDDLSNLRNNLRQRMLASPVTYAEGFTINLETAYRCIWEKWCLARTSS